MAIIPINSPQREQKRDAIDRILQGLQIAQGGFGIASDISKLKSLSEERDLAREKAPLEVDALKAKIDADRSAAKSAALLKPLQIQGAMLENEAKARALTQGTPDQSKAALFAKRMEQAQQVFDDLEKSGYDRSSVGQGMLSLLPEGAQPGSLQQQNQAERNFLNAVLRRESGSAISPKEFAEGAKQYFARAGDAPEVIKQKLENRQLAIAGLRAEAGNAYGNLPATQSLLPRSAKKSSGLLPEANAGSGGEDLYDQYLNRNKPKGGKKP